MGDGVFEDWMDRLQLCKAVSKPRRPARFVCIVLYKFFEEGMGRGGEGHGGEGHGGEGHGGFRDDLRERKGGGGWWGILVSYRLFLSFAAARRRGGVLLAEA